MYAAERFCVCQQAFHFCFCAAVSEFEVVKHGIVLLGEPLIGILDGRHIRAHFVGIVGHIHHRHVRNAGSFVGVVSKAGQQRRREAGGLLHIGVCAQTGRLVGFGRVCFDSLCTVLEQRLNAADALLECCAAVDCGADKLAYLTGRALHKVCNQIPGGDRPLVDALFRRVAVELYFAGDAEICHDVHLSFRARAQGHRLL